MEEIFRALTEVKEPHNNTNNLTEWCSGIPEICAFCSVKFPFLSMESGPGKKNKIQELFLHFPLIWEHFEIYLLEDGMASHEGIPGSSCSQWRSSAWEVTGISAFGASSIGSFLSLTAQCIDCKQAILCYTDYTVFWIFEDETLRTVLTESFKACQSWNEIVTPLLFHRS